jgi:hypothetical protein
LAKKIEPFYGGKRMLKKIFLIGFVSILALSQQGYSKDLAGRFALGIFDSEAPIGCRYWFTPRLGLDIGFGIEAVEENSDHAKSIWLGFGFPYVLHAADRANFFLRPSLLLKSLDDRIHGTGRLEENWTEYEILMTPGAEVFFGEHFSLEAAYGLSIEIVKLPEELSSETFTRLNTESAQVGLHYYFK